MYQSVPFLIMSVPFLRTSRPLHHFSLIVRMSFDWIIIQFTFEVGPLEVSWRAKIDFVRALYILEGFHQGNTLQALPACRTYWAWCL